MRFQWKQKNKAAPKRSSLENPKPTTMNRPLYHSTQLLIRPSCLKFRINVYETESTGRIPVKSEFLICERTLKKSIFDSYQTVRK
jgi:hypothetical protein